MYITIELYVIKITIDKNWHYIDSIQLAEYV